MKSKNQDHFGAVVICAYCNKLLKGQEIWDRATQCGGEIKYSCLSHGICPDCLLVHFPKEYLSIQEQRKIRIKKLFKHGFQELYGHIAR